MKKFQKVPKEDLWLLLGSCIRYSIGRKTYMPSTAVSFVKKYKDSLSDQQLRQLRNEVLEEMERRYMGHQCDIDVWKEFCEWCLEELENRKS